MENIESFQNKPVRVGNDPIYIPLISGGLLKGKTVLITGANRGIGYAIAEACLRNEAYVILAGRNIEKLEAARQKLEREREGKKAAQT